MRFLGRCCFLVVLCSVFELYKRIFRVFLGLFLMNCASYFKLLTQSGGLSSGFLLFGCFSPAFNVLGLFLMFALGFMLLQFNWHGKGLVQYLCEIRGKPRDPKNRFCSKSGFGEGLVKKIASCNKCDSLKLLENSKSGNMDKSLARKEPVEPNNDDNDDKDEGDDDDDEERECSDEDEGFDVMALRRSVKIERQRTIMIKAELEKERMAAASAADETMAMILRLQKERSAVEIEANQYRRLAEKKHEYDQEMIQSLEWIVMKHESERDALKEKLRLCREKLQQYMENDEIKHSEASAILRFLDSTLEDCLEDVTNSSSDMESSIL